MCKSNTVGDSPEICKNYILTVSHCDGENSINKGCKYFVGAFFIARTNLDTVNWVLNRDTAIAKTEVSPKRFITFSHPYADVMKLNTKDIYRLFEV